MTTITTEAYECGSYEDAMKLLASPLDLLTKAREFVTQYPAQAHESAFFILAVSMLHDDEVSADKKELVISLLNAVAETV